MPPYTLLGVALVVGAACGAALAAELGTPPSQRNSWRHWAGFAAVAVVVVSCALIAEQVNKTSPPGAVMQGVGLLFVAVGFALAFRQVRQITQARRQRQK